MGNVSGNGTASAVVDNSVDGIFSNTAEYDTAVVNITVGNAGVNADETTECGETIVNETIVDETVVGSYLEEFASNIGAVVKLNNIASTFWRRRKLLLDFTTPLGEIGVKNCCYSLLEFGASFLTTIVSLIKHKEIKKDVVLRSSKCIKALKHELLDYSPEQLGPQTEDVDQPLDSTVNNYRSHFLFTEIFPMYSLIY